MKIDFSYTFNTLDGQPVVDENQRPVILKNVAQIALLNQYQDEQIDGAEKARRWFLATQLNGGADGVVDLEPEDVAKIKLVIGKAYAPMIVGQAYNMLNG